MNFKIQTLSGIQLSQIVNAFNVAFGDYFVKINLTNQLLLNKINSESIILNFSAGVFVEDNLVAFILSGIDEINGQKVAYNAGTCVIPEFRGNGLTKKMYRFLIPLLENESIYSHQLEVLTQNKVAQKVYESIGFEKRNILSCYRGVLKKNLVKEAIKTEIIALPKQEVLEQFWNLTPSWQNSYNAVVREESNNFCIGYYLENQLKGYLIFNPSNYRIKQIAVDKTMRNRGIGKTLCSSLRAIVGDEEVSVINISNDNQATNGFLTKVGLKKNAEQFEMYFTKT